jgi:L-glyceraldehyde 3-phosphate reductase
MLNRWIEGDLQLTLDEEGIGSIAFCPLAQGLLTNRYLSGIPADSRAAKVTGSLKATHVTRENTEKARRLDSLAQARGQTLAQMALAWVLRKGRVTSALIGASRPEQIIENVGALKNLAFEQRELDMIDNILAGQDMA